ncbi:hypothetical protein [Phyllobacterium myrsinacearum]|uniref:Uncharacterized protein n=1 Tax=Phyllobacterium myrsinacearum TaxID=28101 RepID=A0A839EVW3_9HYPH|nr:hypothetical protein [Phyllobacterium myrsinacearum]MBA8881654.1 hypothetical protein [Phyllobacterium myrsinacearum]
MSCNAPNLFKEVKSESLPVDKVFGEINCGIIMAPDGSSKVFSHGVNQEGLLKRVEDMTKDELAIYWMGQKLFALNLALNNEQLMAILLDAATNLEGVNADPHHAIQ